MIHVKNLTKRYGRTVAVKEASFSIRKGEIVGFLGPNGAGKTTTMRILACFMPPTSGTVTVAGLDIMKDSLEIRRRIGYMPETVPLYPEMRVLEYLDFRAKLKGLRGRRRRSRLGEVVDRCGLAEVSRFLIGRLSKGYRQRVGLADSLIHDPDVLILDEPTIGLDPNQIRHVRALIKNLAESHTVLLSTHILSEVEMICGRVLIMSSGRIVASDSPGNLVGLLKGNMQFVAEVAGPGEKIVEACRQIDGVLSVSGAGDSEWHRLIIECRKGGDLRAPIYETIARNGWKLRELTVIQDRSLEDVFVSVTKDEDVE